MSKDHSKRLLAGAIFFIAASFVYLAAEAIAASAWIYPDYGYAYHYISDLGVSERMTIDDRSVYSPLAFVMNTGFILYGLLSASAYVCMFPLLKKRVRWLLILFAVIQGIGNMLVGLFPGESYDYASMHILGAGMAIIGGNVTLILFGFALRNHQISAFIKGIAMTLGNIGLIALVIMLTNDFGYPAVFERLSVYTMTIWNLIYGTWWIVKQYHQKAVH